MEKNGILEESGNMEALRGFFLNLKAQLGDISNHIQTDEEAKAYFERLINEIGIINKVKNSDNITDAVIVEPIKKEEKLLDKIKHEITEAMKTHDTVITTALRTLVSDINNATNNKNGVADDSLCIDVIQKTIAQRKVTIECYQKVNKTEEVEQETKIVNMLQKYMPIPLDESSVKNIIDDAIREVGASSVNDIGKVMKIIQPKIKNKFDGKKASYMVRTSLTDIVLTANGY